MCKTHLNKRKSQPLPSCIIIKLHKISRKIQHVLLFGEITTIKHNMHVAEAESHNKIVIASLTQRIENKGMHSTAYFHFYLLVVDQCACSRTLVFSFGSAAFKNSGFSTVSVVHLGLSKAF